MQEMDKAITDETGLFNFEKCSFESHFNIDQLEVDNTPDLSITKKQLDKPPISPPSPLPSFLSLSSLSERLIVDNSNELMDILGNINSFSSINKSN
jgi:hypothetical protein